MPASATQGAYPILFLDRLLSICCDAPRPEIVVPHMQAESLPPLMCSDGTAEVVRAGPTLLSARARERQHEATSTPLNVDAAEVKKRWQPSQDATFMHEFEFQYWPQIEASHLARQEEQWRHVQECHKAEEQRMQGVRLRAVEDAKRERVAKFLAEHGFPGLNAKKCTCMFPICGRFTYALHTAVRLNDADLVEVLVWAGADTELEDSGRQTALALAQALNGHGSHDHAVAILLAPAAVGRAIVRAGTRQ